MKVNSVVGVTKKGYNNKVYLFYFSQEEESEV